MTPLINDRARLSLRYPTDAAGKVTQTCSVALSDGLFPRRGGFSPQIARAAAALAASSADKKYVEDNLRALGYMDVNFVAYNHQDRDKIGMCLSSRMQDDSLVVAVVLRGTEGCEWYSNFDVGYSAEHHGFAAAADFAELRLGDYVFTHAIGCEPRFFVTGYSRGGAVANILAKRLCDRYGSNSVCAYTFAAPATTISRRVNRYGSIYNLVRDEDFFTRIPPAGWGYSRYGHDISLSDTGDITERFKELTGDEYIGFTRQAPIDSFLGAVMNLAPNIHAYYERRRSVGDRRMSLYEFMTAVADLLSKNDDESCADVFMSAMLSEYADLMSFMSSGADLGDILSSADAVPRCSVSDSHSMGAYMAALENLAG